MAPMKLVSVPEWEEEQRLTLEKETLGLYLTGHPINRYEKELRQFTHSTLAEIADLVGSGNQGFVPQKNQPVYTLAGLMVGMRIRKANNGNKIVSATLDDRTGRIEVRIFEDQYEKYGPLLIKDKLLIVEGNVAYDDFSDGYRITARTMYDISQARQRFAKRPSRPVVAAGLPGVFVEASHVCLSKSPCIPRIQERAQSPWHVRG